MTSSRDRRAFDAILLDLDGTLVTDEGHVHPRTLASLRRADAAGVRVMLATGRSELGALPVLETLGFETPAVVFNGAGIYCPVEERLLEERLLADRTVALALEYAERKKAYPVVIRRGEKFAPHPRSEHERRAVRSFEGLRFCSTSQLATEFTIRVTLFSETHADSGAFLREVEAALDRPTYLTDFPLNALADHRENPLQVVDVQPPCRGKGEALRFLRERYAIAPERVVAVGDATNDLPMMELAGLSVAMENAMPEVHSAADRVIGSNNSDAIATLVDELFA